MSTEMDTGRRSSQPRLHQHGVEIQRFETLRLLPIALAHDARMESVQLLNGILADTVILHSHYKKVVPRRASREYPGGRKLMEQAVTPRRRG